MIEVQGVDYIRVPVSDIDYEFAPLPSSTIALGVADVGAAKSQLEAAGIEVSDLWDSGVCNGAGVTDPAGNRILLHHRYVPHES